MCRHFWYQSYGKFSFQHEMIKYFLFIETVELMASFYKRLFDSVQQLIEFAIGTNSIFRVGLFDYARTVSMAVRVNGGGH